MNVSFLHKKYNKFCTQINKINCEWSNDHLFYAVPTKVCTVKTNNIDELISFTNIKEGELVTWCVGNVENRSKLKETSQRTKIDMFLWSQQLKKIQTGRETKFFNTFETGWQCINNMDEAETEEEANLRYTIRLSPEGIPSDDHIFFYATKDIELDKKLACKFWL